MRALSFLRWREGGQYSAWGACVRRGLPAVPTTEHNVPLVSSRVRRWNGLFLLIDGQCEHFSPYIAEHLGMQILPGDESASDRAYLWSNGCFYSRVEDSDTDSLLCSQIYISARR
ncbi:MAG: hypothetical protein ACI9W2_002534 [Gammaproteobacteria bacterium]|jgi:hypothetical protein